MTKHQPKRLSLHRLGNATLAAITFHTFLAHVLRQASNKTGKGMGVLWVDVLFLSRVTRSIKFRACVLRLPIVLQQVTLGAMNVDLLRLLVLHCSDHVREKCGLVTTNMGSALL